VRGRLRCVAVLLLVLLVVVVADTRGVYAASLVICHGHSACESAFHIRRSTSAAASPETLRYGADVVDATSVVCLTGHRARGGGGIGDRLETATMLRELKARGV
jgi:hypothetical protein